MMVLRIKEHEMTTPKTRVVEGVTYEQESESEHYGRRCDECVAAPFLSPLCDTLAPRFCHAIWQVAKPAATPALSVGEYAIQVEYLRGNRMNSFADTIESLVAKVAELSSQYGDEVSRTAQLLEECDALQLKFEGAEKDAVRLDYVLRKLAFIEASDTDAGGTAFQLLTQDEDENFILLSGDGFYPTHRAAIDAAHGITKEPT
jgi:hypothetical protein